MIDFVGIGFRFGEWMFAKENRFNNFSADIEFDSFIKRLNVEFPNRVSPNNSKAAHLLNLNLGPTRHLAIYPHHFLDSIIYNVIATQTAHIVRKVLKRDRDFISLNAVIRSTRQVRKRIVFVSLIFLHYGKLN